MVKHIIAPAQIPIEERNPVPTEEERWADALARHQAKVERKAAAKLARAAEKRQGVGAGSASITDEMLSEATSMARRVV